MANSKTIWRGSESAQLTITQIQEATKAHISSYAFYCNTSDLTGNITNASTNTTSITGAARVNKSKDYTITSYLIYSHKFGNGSTTATSNKVNNTITVHEPLNNESLNSISINDAWVWSNAISKDFTITPKFDTLSPFSYEGQYISDSTTATEPKGYIQSSTIGDITGAIKTLTWHKTTGGSTDLKAEYKNITIKVKSTANSAPSAVEIANRSAAIKVRNAVISLSGLSNATTFGKATTKITQTVNFNPTVPYSTLLKLVTADGVDIQNNTVTKAGSVLKLEGNKITLDASGSTNTKDPVEFSFMVRSEQSAEAVDTQLIRFTVSPVDDIINQTVVEGQIITIQNAGIGTILRATVNNGPIEVDSTNGTSISLKGLAVDANTSWTVTIENSKGTAIKIKGTTTALADVSASINTGDYIIVGKSILADIGESISAIVEQPSKGTASIANEWLKYEASTTNGPIAAGTYAIKVKGANGATRTVNITVSDITVTVS